MIYLNRISWALMTGLAVLLFGMTAMYWTFQPDINFLLEKQDVVHHPVWRTAFYIHILGGMLSIIIGPLQFLKKFRARNMKLHRLLGKIYLTSILFIGAPSGLYMAFYAEGGWAASLGFVLMSIFWFYTTYMAYYKIRKRDVAAHLNWMTRSYALTFSAVTLRLWVPFCSYLLGMDHQVVVILSAWMSWLINLLAAEIIIKHRLYNFNFKSSINNLKNQSP